VAQDVTQDVAEDVTQNVAEGAFGAAEDKSIKILIVESAIFHRPPSCP